jgi:hypothetical protein
MITGMGVACLTLPDCLTASTRTGDPGESAVASSLSRVFLRFDLVSAIVLLSFDYPIMYSIRFEGRLSVAIAISAGKPL